MSNDVSLAQLEAQDLPSYPQRPRRVLIVDDDIDFAETIAEIIEPEDIEVALAHGFQEAIDLLDSFQPHVALLDIRLDREHSGTDLIDVIRLKAPGALSVMMTGYAALETAIQALKRGAYDYMRKPISPDDLFATLKRCFHTVDLVYEKAKADRILALRNRELEQINDRLRHVVRAAERLTANSSLETLLPGLLSEFSHLLGAHGGSIYVVGDGGLELVHTLEMPHAPRRIPFPLEEGTVLRQAYAASMPVLIEDFGATPFRCSTWTGYENGSALVFPIMDEVGRVNALITLHNKTQPPFTEQDQEIGSVLLSISGEVLRTQQAFAAVAESRRRFREMTELLPAVVFELDEHGTFIYLNREVESVSGFVPEELKDHKKIHQLLNEPERVAKHLTACCQGNTMSEDFTLNHKEEGLRHVLLQTACIVRDKKVIGQRGFMFDITSRKQAEAEHAQLAMAVEQAAELILITDVNGRILYANPAYRQLTHFTQEEIRGHNFHNFENARDDATFLEKLWETLKKGKVWQGRVRAFKQDGTPYVAEASISPLRDEEGHVVNYVAVLRDLTHETRLEARLRQAEKLEAIGTLAGGIAHDFNNILSPIIGFTEIVREDLPRDSESVGHLEKVLNACHLAKELVARILTFSRQMESERRPIQVDQVVREALKLLRPSIPSTIEIAEQIECPECLVLSDPSQVHQLIMNLATNAYHAMEDRGRLEITLSQLEADEALAQELPRLLEGRIYICLVVRDDGVGMDSRTLERIFDPFFSTKEQGKGTGLGLATVHGIVAELGGDIAVTSEKGNGTTVRVYMPRHEEEELDFEGPVLPILQPAKAGKGRVMLVDDEDMILQLGQMMLKRLGYRADCFNDPVKALAHFLHDANAYDLLITDQTMPGLTGQQLAERVRASNQVMPILLTTGFSTLVKEEQLRQIGIHSVVHKPFTRQELGLAIQAAMATAGY